MAQTRPEPIYLLVTDLVALNPRKLQRSSSASSKLKLNFLQSYHFAPFKHWALQIRDCCYEVNSKPSAGKSKKPEYVLNNSLSLEEWEKTVEENDLAWERVPVGATVSTDRDIHVASEIIWADRFKKKYRLDKQNCQNFSYLLYKCIAIDPEKIKNDMNIAWKSMPRCWSDIFHIIRSSVTSSVARSIMIEYVAEAAILGAEAVGLEGILGLELLGIEIAGVALLGPIGEVIFAVTIIALILKKNKDNKWLKKFRKLANDYKAALGSGHSEQESEATLKEQAGLILDEITEEEELITEGQVSLCDNKALITNVKPHGVKSAILQSTITRMKILESKVGKSTIGKSAKELSARPFAKSFSKSSTKSSDTTMKASEFNSVQEFEIEAIKDLLSFSDGVSGPDITTRQEEPSNNKPGSPPPTYHESIRTESKEKSTYMSMRRKPLPAGAVTAYTNTTILSEHRPLAW